MKFLPVSVNPHRHAYPLGYTSLLVLGAITCASCLSACSPDAPVIDVSISAPDSLKDKAAFTQIAVFEGDCPDQATLLEGNVREKAVAISTASKDGSFSEIGELNQSPYGFAALMRKADCSVLAAVCVPVDFSHHRRVAITFSAGDEQKSPQGACNSSGGEQCVDGLCETGVDGGLPDAPSYDGCHFQVVRSGNFSGPAKTAHFNGPAAFSTPDGFLVAMRQGASDELSTQMLMIPVGLDGTTQQARVTALRGCPKGTRFGVSGTWASSNDAKGGLIVSSAGDCNGPTSDYPKNVFHIVSFGSHGDNNHVTVFGDDQTTFEISPRHAVAPDPAASNIFKVAMVLKSNGGEKKAFLSTIEVPPGDSDPKPEVPDAVNNGDGPASHAFVTSSGNKQVVIADNVKPDASPSLYVNLADIASPIVMPGRTEWFGLSSDTGYVALAYPEPTDAGIAVSRWKQLGFNGGVTLAEGTFAHTGKSADIASAGNHLVLAVGEFGDIVLQRLDRTGANQPFQSSTEPLVKLSQDENAPTSLSKFDGQNMAIAWSQDRLLVTWITNKTDIDSTTPSGGYAVLACDAK